VPCQRYDDDEYFFNPYGYHRLADDCRWREGRLR
jgi:hypothetical protein